jgi:hypothetical protein
MSRDDACRQPRYTGRTSVVCHWRMA